MLSVDAWFVRHLTSSLDDKTQVFTAACIIEQDVNVNTIIFEPFPAQNDSDTTRNRAELLKRATLRPYR
jgi:hypothetical protein